MSGAAATVAIWAVLVSLFLPATLSALQQAGIGWAHRIGIPVREFRASRDLVRTVESTDWVRAAEKGGVLFFSEQIWRTNPMQGFWNSGWPDKLVGVAERHENSSTLTVRADPLTSCTWLFFVVMIVMFVASVALRRPGVQDARGFAFAFGLAVLCITGLVFFVRRARRRAAALAEHLGFLSPFADCERFSR